MSTNKMLSTAQKGHELFVAIVSKLQHPFLLAMRLWFGSAFMLTGWGKLTHIDRPIAFFQQLHIPMPVFNAYLVGCVECFGGVLLLLGLCSRLVCIPLIINMTVAYLAADADAVKTFFSDFTDIGGAFIKAAPFPFLLTVIIVLIFGPGIFSIDFLIRKFWFQKRTSGA